MYSTSNGCLMRITPLAVWGHKLSDEDLLQAVKLQTNLTHSHNDPNLACYLYCLAIKHLINNPGDAKGAYQKAMKNSGHLEYWFKEIESNQLPPATKNIGNTRVAFTHAFSFLKRIADGEKLSYE